MKKIILIFFAIIIISLIYNKQTDDVIIIPDSSIRLRVIPNSNSLEDQKMKNKVKEYLEKNTYNLVGDELDINSARINIQNNIPIIEKEIGEIFKLNNYDKEYNINFGQNYFPEKKYHNVVYEEGYYESVVISIGNAEGDNWWCFLFPNTCLIELKKKEDTKYESWIINSINKIFK